MEFYNNQEVVKTVNPIKDHSVALSMTKVYLYFALGLILTGIAALAFPYIAVAIGGSGEAGMNIYTGGIITSAILLFPLSLVVGFHAMSQKSGWITTCYCLYSLAMGVLLSSCFMMFDINDIFYAFFITAGTFLVMSLIGYFSKGRMSTLMTVISGLSMGTLVMCLVNMFFFNSMVYWISSLGMMLVMVLFVAFDTNRVKNFAQSRMFSNSNSMAVFCAYTLYTDFITIFLYILRFVAIFMANKDN